MPTLTRAVLTRTQAIMLRYAHVNVEHAAASIATMPAIGEQPKPKPAKKRKEMA
jgi:hypothetical protein